MRELVPPDPSLELLHTRSYETKIYRLSDTELLARGVVRDTKPPGLYIEGDPDELDIHEMAVELRVSLPGLVITAARVDMATHPAASCPNIAGHYESLVGVSIARGFSQKLRELFGGPRGCSHTTALIQSMGPAIVQATWSVHVRGLRRGGATVEDTEARRKRQFAGNLDTCHVWAEDGERVARMRGGERPPPPLSVIRRLEELGRDPSTWGAE